jgi:hypothetical protein
MSGSDIDVRVLEDPGLAGWLTELVNHVYAIAEHGLWRAGAKLTTVSDFDEYRAEVEVPIR